MRMGRAAEAAGDPEKALRRIRSSTTNFPSAICRPPPAWRSIGFRTGRRSRPARTASSWSWAAREQLFGGRRYTQAREAFARSARARRRATTSSSSTSGIAESDYFLKRLRAARDGVKPYIEKASRQGEALFFYAVALYDLGERDEYFRRRAPHGRRVSDRDLVGRSAQPPRHPLHRRRRRREGGRDVPGDVREVSVGTLRRARGLEDRVAGVQESAVRGNDSRVRARLGQLPAIGLPPGVAVLVGAGVRGSR